jgi:hypothetical protein
MPRSDSESENQVLFCAERFRRSSRPRTPIEIVVDDAEELYREIRVENSVCLKRGAPVEVTIEAHEKETIKKNNSAGA